MIKVGSDNGNWIEKKLDKTYRLVGDYFCGWRMEGDDDGNPIFYISIHIEDIDGNVGGDYYCVFPKDLQNKEYIPPLSVLKKRYGKKFNQLYSRIKTQNKSDWKVD